MLRAWAPVAAEPSTIPREAPPPLPHEPKGFAMTASAKTSTQRVIEWSWRALIFLVAVGLLAAITLRWSRWEGRPGWQQSDDAYLQADQTPIAARAPGYLRAVPVQDYQRVKAGTVLAEIADDDYRAAAAQA